MVGAGVATIVLAIASTRAFAGPLGVDMVIARSTQPTVAILLVGLLILVRLGRARGLGDR